MFEFYDLDGDGRISREELAISVHAIYRMLHGNPSINHHPESHNNAPGGDYQSSKNTTFSATNRISQIMTQLDPESTGFIELEAYKQQVLLSEHSSDGSSATIIDGDRVAMLQGLLLYDGLL